METIMSMPVRAALGVSGPLELGASLDASRDAWYAAGARLLPVAAQLCPTAAVAAHKQDQAGSGAARVSTSAAQHAQVNAPRAARDGFTLPEQPGFPPQWWTSV